MAQGKKFIPTSEERKQVEAMSGFGLPHDEIAVLIRGGIDADTLKKHFRDELIAGRAKANSQVGKTLWQKATSGDTAAAIWWTKSRMRWSEKIDLEHTGDVNMNHRIIEHVIVRPRNDETSED